MAVHAQHGHTGRGGAGLRRLIAMTVVLCWVTPGLGGDLKIKRIRVESTPDGAAVSTIVGRLGVTPLNITERDIYPNTYSEEKLDLYGKVILSKPGCKTVTRRVTLDDIKDGLDVRLDCSAATPVADRKAAVKPRAIPQPEPSAAPVAEPLSARRLRQLKVLNELLEDGLITAEQERVIRTRIFERLEQGDSGSE